MTQFVEITMTVPSVIGIMRAGASVQVNATDLSPEIWARLAEHGFGQKVGDAAAGSKEGAAEANMEQKDFARGMMQKVIDQLMTGTWGASRGAGESDTDRAEKYVAAAAIRAQLEGDKPGLKAFNALEGDELAKRLESAITKLKSIPAYDFDGKVKARVAHVIEARAKREAEKREAAAAKSGLGEITL